MRGFENSFMIEDSTLKHLCFVFEPLQEPLRMFRRGLVDGVIPPEILRMLVQMMLHGLDHLHSELRFIQKVRYGILLGVPFEYPD